MGVTAENSDQLALIAGQTRRPLEQHDWHGKLRYYLGNFTQRSEAGDAGSQAQLLKLPGGKVRLVLPFYKIIHSAFGAAATLSLGWAAYGVLGDKAINFEPNEQRRAS